MKDPSDVLTRPVEPVHLNILANLITWTPAMVAAARGGHDIETAKPHARELEELVKEMLARVRGNRPADYVITYGDLRAVLEGTLEVCLTYLRAE